MIKKPFSATIYSQFIFQDAGSKCAPLKSENHVPVIVNLTFLTIVSISSGFLIFLLILVVNEAKMCKKEKKRAAQRKRVSMSRRRSSGNPDDINDMYDKIDANYLPNTEPHYLEDGSRRNDSYTSYDMDSNERTLTSQQFYDVPDTAKNAELLLKDLFVFQDPSAEKEDQIAEEAIYENVPKAGESLKGWFGSMKIMRRNTTFNHTTRRPSEESQLRKSSFSSYKSPPVILDGGPSPRRNSSMRASASTSIMVLQDIRDGSIKYSSQRRRRPALVFSNQLSYCDDTYSTIV